MHLGVIPAALGFIMKLLPKFWLLNCLNMPVLPGAQQIPVPIKVKSARCVPSIVY